MADPFMPPMPGAWSPPPQYQSVNAKPPQNLKSYRPSIPSGVDMKKFAYGPSVNIREYPYLRRGPAAEGYVTPPGMEMPEDVPSEKSSTWSDRIRQTLFPFGDPLTFLPRIPVLGR
jgi:hypothetical protein